MRPRCWTTYASCAAGSCPGALGPGPAPSEVISCARRTRTRRRPDRRLGRRRRGDRLRAARRSSLLGRTARRRCECDPARTVGDRTDDVVGGGWFGWFGFDARPGLAFYDHVLRWREGTWFFEALWSEQRAAYLERRLADSFALLSQTEPASAAKAQGALLSQGEQSKGDSDAKTASWSLAAFGGASMPQHLAAVETCRRMDPGRRDLPGQRLHRAGGGLRRRCVPRCSPAPPTGCRRASVHTPTAATGQSPCLSPELFLRRRGRDVITSPIKGTWPRSRVRRRQPRCAIRPRTPPRT